MTLSNTSLVAEFQHYFHDFVLGSTVNKNQIPMPVDIDPMFLTKQSVVELIFSETFPYNSYYYLYGDGPTNASWPLLVRQRLMIYPSSKYLIPGETGNNIFNLQADDFLMLDVLLRYRHDSTSVVLIDTTADSTSIIIVDSTATGIVTITGSVSGLHTPLSKLIFLYLDLHLNGNYLGYYNIPAIISDCSMLATVFELKLIDDYFDFISNRSASLLIWCNPETGRYEIR